ncbi:hypothetical protein FGB62_350g08 [Gracilaria domingensis]|nr:hypothetical protein FGB62_350g08 [Gracilaria domingensis]
MYENSWENDMRTDHARDQTTRARHTETSHDHSSSSEHSDSEHADSDLISSAPLRGFAQHAPLPQESSSSFRLPSAPAQFRQPRMTHNSRVQLRRARLNDQQQTQDPNDEIGSNRLDNIVQNSEHVSPDNLLDPKGSSLPLQVAVGRESSCPQASHNDFNLYPNPNDEFTQFLSRDECHAAATSPPNNDAESVHTSKTRSNYSSSALRNTDEYSSAPEHVLEHDFYNDGKERELCRLMDVLNIVEYSGMSKNQSRALLQTNSLQSRYSYDALIRHALSKSAVSKHFGVMCAEEHVAAYPLHEREQQCCPSQIGDRNVSKNLDTRVIRGRWAGGMLKDVQDDVRVLPHGCSR